MIEVFAMTLPISAYRTLLKFWLITGKLWRTLTSRMGSLSSGKLEMREKISTDTSSKSGMVMFYSCSNN